MMASKPAARVHAILELFRPFADEVVLAVDAGADAELIDRCHGLADQVHRLEPAPFNRWSGWLHSRCSADWILRFDDDEVPSRGLLDGLPALLEGGPYTNVAFTRRWLLGDPGRYITSHPWLPDYQIRLVLNAPGLWRFPGVMHAPIEVLGERRHEDLPIYHCDCLMASVEQRREKRALYDGRRVHLTSDGFPVNSMYVPEDVPGVQTAEVPEADRRLIDAVREGSRFEGEAARAPETPLLTLADDDRYSETRAVPGDAYDARLEFVAPPRTLRAGSLSYHELEVENRGSERWPSAQAGEPLIRLGSRWLDPARPADGGPEGPRTAFTETVAPGRTTRVMLAVEAPPAPGRFVLEVDVVHEGVRWFDNSTRLEVGVSEDDG